MSEDDDKDYDEKNEDQSYEDYFDYDPTKELRDVITSLLDKLPQEMVLKIANDRIDAVYFTREQMIEYPVLFRERVTTEEKKVIQSILTAMRLTGLSVDHKDVISFRQNSIITTEFYCPVCGKTVGTMFEHNDKRNPGEWECQEKTK